MRTGFFLTSIAALSLVATPAFAANNPASSLSVAKSVRAGAPSARGSHLAGGVIIPVVLALAIIGAGIVIAVDNDDKPDSP
jgi:hypothetical protein